MRKPTERQIQVLNFIRQHLDDNGFPPTRSEIAEALGFRSINAAEQHLRALANKGVIELLSGASRGIRLLNAVEDELPIPNGLPLIGRVAAGVPILAEENIEDYRPLGSEAFSPPADYLLRVSGMSMRDVGILDGDLLAVHKTEEAFNGQIVVARIEDEVTVKRFKRHGNWVRLIPENPDYEVIRVDLREQEVKIEGLGVGILRTGLNSIK